MKGLYLINNSVDSKGKAMPLYWVHTKTLADNQHFDCTTFVWESLLIMVVQCKFFGAISFSNNLSSANDIAAVGTIFYVFCCDTVLAEIWTHHHKVISKILPVSIKLAGHNEERSSDMIPVPGPDTTSLC